MTKPIFIAEVKTRSPFGFRSGESWDNLFELAAEHGDWVAVHTHPAWDGHMGLIAKARALTDKPILAKGIHHTDAQVLKALEMGATHVLTVGRVSEAYTDRTIFEPLTIDQMYLPMYVHPTLKVMWNQRNLVTGGTKHESVTDVARMFSGWLCKASLIRHPQDVVMRTDINAFIVGAELRSFVEEWKALQA